MIVPTMGSTRRQFFVTAGAAAAAAGAACSAQPSRLHVVLLGDSIFDNGRYVSGKPSVIDQLGTALGERGKATLLAEDGSVCADVSKQVAAIPDDATHLVVSAGGNDALRNQSVLDRDVKNSAELFAELAQIHSEFRTRYAAMLRAALGRGKPVAVCTVYDSNFEQPKKALADVALSVFNDAILRCAGAAGVPVIDLRRIFTERGDYANEIEPSDAGGAKMAKVIVRVAAEHPFTSRTTSMYA